MTDITVGDIRPTGLLVTPSWHVLRQQVLHLAQFSGGVQIICAKKGGGKSSLLRLIKEEAQGSFFDLRVSEGLATLDFLVGITNKLGFSTGEGSSVGEQLSNLRSYSQGLEKERRRVIVAIDDAHQLLDGDVAALISVLQGHPDTGFGLHFLLFAEPGLAERIDKLQLLDVYVHDVQVPPFSCNEIQNLLEAQGRLAGSTGFTGDQVQSIWHRSGGLPGRAIDLAKSLQQVGGDHVEVKSKQWPWSHLVAIGVLVVILSWAVFFRSETETHSSEAHLTEAKVPPSGPAVSEKPSSNGSVDVNEQAQIVDAPAVDRDLPITTSGSQTSDVQEAKVETLDGIEGASVSGEKMTQLPEALEQNVHKTEVQAPDEVESAASESRSELQNEAKLEGQLQDWKDLSDEAFIERSQSELMKLSPRGYVLQIMAISQLPKLREYWERQPNKKHLKIYQTRRNGRDLFILVEGFYADRGSAQAAISNLPVAQSKGGPWPKRLSELRTEMVR